MDFKRQPPHIEIHFSFIGLQQILKLYGLEIKKHNVEHQKNPKSNLSTFSKFLVRGQNIHCPFISILIALSTLLFLVLKTDQSEFKLFPGDKFNTVISSKWYLEILKA